MPLNLEPESQFQVQVEGDASAVQTLKAREERILTFPLEGSTEQISQARCRDHTT